LEWAGCGGGHLRADSATYNFLRPTDSDRFLMIGLCSVAFQKLKNCAATAIDV
jgi:hypothetical protein